MDIASILGATSRHFAELLEDDANPLVVALALMDGSSVGKAMHAGEFDQLHDALRQCLKTEVGANFEGFNTSISLYHTLVNSVNANHQTAQSLQGQLAEIRRCVQERNPIVGELQASSLRYKKDLELLNIAETLKGVPDRYEAFVSQKQFLNAHECLSSALDTILTSNMLKYPPIVPIHAYVVQQQMALADAIQAEIDSHLYLTSPYALARLRDEQPDMRGFLDGIGEPLEIDVSALESDSFLFIRYLVEILAKIGRLEQVAETIIGKAGHNVHKVVERTTAEYIKRQGVTLESLASPAGASGSSGSSSGSSGILEQLESNTQHLKRLEGLASAVYARLKAVLEGHRVLYELVKTKVQYNILHVYAAVETEVLGILNSYIAVPAARLRRKSFDSSHRSHLSSSKRSAHHGAHHVAKSELARGPQFELAGDGLDPSMQAEFDQLRVSMRKWVPGLKLGELTGELEDAQTEAISVVAPASVLNIKALAAPTAQFLQSAKLVLDEPQCAQRIHGLLPQFFQLSYLPALKGAVERYVDDLCEAETGEPYAEYKQVSRLPVLATAAKSVELVSRLCVTLNTNAYSRPEYVDVLLTAMEMFRDFCAFKIKEGLGSRAIQQLARSDNVRQLHRELYESGGANLDAELVVYLRNMATQKSRLQLGDLLDIETFRLYAVLATSIKWAVARLRQMGVKSDSAAAAAPDSVSLVRREWALAEGTGEARILLAGDSWDRFSDILEHLSASNRQLLSLLRCDLMCRIVYHFDEMARGGYDLSADTEDVDHEIELLQTNLSTCHKISQLALVAQDRAFVFAGCAKLMNELFIKESVNLGVVNENGVRKMFSNILSLQQVLKSVVSLPQDVDFSRSVDFYESLRKTPMRAIDAVRQGKSKLLEEDLVLVLQVKYKEERERTRDHNSSLQQYNEQVQQVRRMFS